MAVRDVVQAAAGIGGDKLYVDDVFSTYIYNGNSSTQTITNGIDLAGEGGMVWLKGRSGATAHYLFDTVRGANKALTTVNTNAEATTTDILTSFSSNGATLSSNASTNGSGSIYTSWTFRNAPKFFTHTTVSHTNGVATNIDLSSLETVGMVVAKITNTTGDWITWHRSLTAGNNLRLNTTAAQTTTNAWLSVSGTTATLSSSAPTGTYVIYAWAHDTASDGMIQCGSVVDGSTVNLGWEPQFCLFKQTAGITNWNMFDSLRGIIGANSLELNANVTNAEAANGGLTLTPTGFTLDRGGIESYVYLAIRMPNKPPTTGTEVFTPTVYTGTNVDNRLVNTGIKTDMAMFRMRSGSGTGYEGFVVGDRLRGQPWLKTGANFAEQSIADGLDKQLVSAVEYGTAFSSMTGVWVGNNTSFSTNINASTIPNNHIALAFKRAPGFFDVVCYTGTATSMVIPHNLGSAPEFVIVKARSSAFNWFAFQTNFADKYLLLNTSDAIAQNIPAQITCSTTSTSISLGGSTSLTASGTTYVAYLFATLPGISKVGSYTGTGTTQQINCGFSSGARFVLIKRTDSTGDWYVWDSARGIVSGNDPYLLLNSTAVENTSTDYIDPYSAGFEISSTAPAAINASGGSFVYLAIA